MALYSIPDIRNYVSDITFHADGSFDIAFHEGKGIPTHIIDEIKKRLKSIPGVELNGFVPKTVNPYRDEMPQSLIVFIGSFR